MSTRQRVALLIETSNAYARGILQGIIQYINQHEPWSVYLPEQERTANPPAWLADWQGDGIIARVETDSMATAVENSQLPAVDVSAARRVPDIPWVETDDLATAELAADHLIERGFRNLAYVSDPGFNWSKWREQNFANHVRQSGAKYFLYESTSRLSADYRWQDEEQSLADWLANVPKPIGIMACYDIKAQQVLDVCRKLDLAVPEQVAVIGVDDDQLLCSLASPPLSSVIPNSRGVGFEAASLLHQMMSGQQVESEPRLIKPLGIRTRQSTDVTAIEDDEIAKTLRYIREHAIHGINVHDVMQHTELTRRVLESRYQKLLGRSPHQEIIRQRIAKVRQLLQETELPLETIARRCGFEHSEYLSVMFKRETGLTTTQFRNTHRDQTGTSSTV